jgi:hypothetical protein
MYIKEQEDYADNVVARGCNIIITVTRVLLLLCMQIFLSVGFLHTRAYISAK